MVVRRGDNRAVTNVTLGEELEYAPPVDSFVGRITGL